MSLAEQLTKLAANVQAVAAGTEAGHVVSINNEQTAKKRRVSFLFDAKKASSLDADDIYSLGLNGFLELKEMDPRFAPFETTLFGLGKSGHQSFDRLQQTPKTLKRLNESLDNFFVLVSPYFLLKATHKALEHLIWKFEVHQYNTKALLAAFLPFHETRTFARLLELLPLQETQWRLLLGQAKQHKSPLSHVSLVNRCAQELSLVQFVCGMARSSAALFENRAHNPHTHKTLFAFCTTTLAATVHRASQSRKGLSDALINELLPTLLAAVRAHHCVDFQTAGFILVPQLVQCAAGLAEATFESLLGAVLSSLKQPALSAATMQRVLLCALACLKAQPGRERKELSDKVLAALQHASSSQVVDTLTSLHEQDYEVWPLVLPLLLRLVRNADCKWLLALTSSAALEWFGDDENTACDNVTEIMCSLLHCATTVKKKGKRRERVVKLYADALRDLYATALHVSCAERGVAVDTVLGQTMGKLQGGALCDVAGRAFKNTALSPLQGSTTTIFLGLNHPSDDIRRQSLAKVELMLADMDADTDADMDTSADGEGDESSIADKTQRLVHLVFSRLEDRNVEIVKQLLGMDVLARVVQPELMAGALSRVVGLAAQAVLGYQHDQCDHLWSAADAVRVLEYAVEFVVQRFLIFHKQHSDAVTVPLLSALACVLASGSDAQSVLRLLAKGAHPLFLNLPTTTEHLVPAIVAHLGAHQQCLTVLCPLLSRADTSVWPEHLRGENMACVREAVAWLAGMAVGRCLASDESLLPPQTCLDVSAALLTRMQADAGEKWLKHEAGDLSVFHDTTHRNRLPQLSSDVLLLLLRRVDGSADAMVHRIFRSLLLLPSQSCVLAHVSLLLRSRSLAFLCDYLTAVPYFSMVDTDTDAEELAEWALVTLRVLQMLQSLLKNIPVAAVATVLPHLLALLSCPSGAFDNATLTVLRDAALGCVRVMVEAIGTHTESGSGEAPLWDVRFLAQRLVQEEQGIRVDSSQVVSSMRAYDHQVKQVPLFAWMLELCTTWCHADPHRSWLASKEAPRAMTVLLVQLMNGLGNLYCAPVCMSLARSLLAGACTSPLSPALIRALLTRVSPFSISQKSTSRAAVVSCWVECMACEHTDVAKWAMEVVTQRTLDAVDKKRQAQVLDALHANLLRSAGHKEAALKALKRLKLRAEHVSGGLALANGVDLVAVQGDEESPSPRLLLLTSRLESLLSLVEEDGVHDAALLTSPLLQVAAGIRGRMHGVRLSPLMLSCLQLAYKTLVAVLEGLQRHRNNRHNATLVTKQLHAVVREATSGVQLCARLESAACTTDVAPTVQCRHAAALLAVCGVTLDHTHKGTEVLTSALSLVREMGQCTSVSREDEYSYNVVCRVLQAVGVGVGKKGITAEFAFPFLTAAYELCTHLSPHRRTPLLRFVCTLVQPVRSLAVVLALVLAHEYALEPQEEQDEEWQAFQRCEALFEGVMAEVQVHVIGVLSSLLVWEDKACATNDVKFGVQFTPAQRARWYRGLCQLLAARVQHQEFALCISNVPVDRVTGVQHAAKACLQQLLQRIAALQQRRQAQKPKKSRKKQHQETTDTDRDIADLQSCVERLMSLMSLEAVASSLLSFLSDADMRPIVVELLCSHAAGLKDFGQQDVDDATAAHLLLVQPLSELATAAGVSAQVHQNALSCLSLLSDAFASRVDKQQRVLLQSLTTLACGVVQADDCVQTVVAAVGLLRTLVRRLDSAMMGEVNRVASAVLCLLELCLSVSPPSERRGKKGRGAPASVHLSVTSEHLRKEGARVSVERACLQCLEQMLLTMPGSVSPFVDRMALCVASARVAVHHADSAMPGLLTRRVSLRVLVPLLTRCLKDMVRPAREDQDAGAAAAGVVFRLVCQACQHAPAVDVVQYATELLAIVELGLQCRARVYRTKSPLPWTLDAVADMEQHVFAAFLAVVMKTNEKQFQSMFHRLAGDLGIATGDTLGNASPLSELKHMCHAASFFRLTHTLADKLDSMFVPYLARIFKFSQVYLAPSPAAPLPVSDDEEEEEEEEEVQTSKRRKMDVSPDEKEADRQRQLLLQTRVCRDALLDTLCTGLRADADSDVDERFMDSTKIDEIGELLVQQLVVADVEIGRGQFTKEESESEYAHVSDALVALAQTVSQPEHWKSINNSLLMETRNDSRTVRVHALRVIHSVFMKLGHFIEPLMIESLQYWLECAQDSDEEVERWGRAVVDDVGALLHTDLWKVDR